MFALANCGDPQSPTSTDAAVTSADAPSSDAPPMCGNGFIESGETCDDGNQILEACAYGEPSCTVCDPTCNLVAGATSVCGDGYVDTAAGEQCDDSNSVSESCSYGEVSCQVCLADCHVGDGETSYCGDDVLDTANGEGCDNGVANSDTEADACRTTCDLPTCGDGVLDSGEGCDARTLRWQQVAAAEQYACGILSDGTLRCWGASTFPDGTPTTPPTGTFTHVAVEQFHACGIRSSGAAVCWGESLGYGELVPPSEQYQRIEVGLAHSCGIRSDGKIHCWGDSFLSTNAPTVSVRELVGYGYRACAITTNDVTICWDGSSSSTYWNDTVELDAGLSHLCAVRTGGTISCNGDNNDGQTSVPAGTYKHVAAAYSHTCAVRTDDTIVCWGDVWNTIEPPNVALVQLSADFGYNCGLDAAGQLYCWGFDSSSGQARPPGNSDFTPDACRNDCQPAHCGDGVLDEPEDCDDGDTADTGNGCSTQCVRNSVCGDGQVQGLYETCDDGNTELETCAYGIEDCPVCDGTCHMGQGNRSYCGDGLLDSANGEECDDALFNSDTNPNACRTTCQLAGCGDSVIDSGENCDDGNAVTESCTYGQSWCAVCDSTCVRTVGATSYCGDGVVDTANAEECDDANREYRSVARGSDFTCALYTVEGTFGTTITCWGQSAKGQTTPPTGEFTSVTAGQAHACALGSDGRVKCWGDNGSGQAPSLITATYVQVAAGGKHTCAIRASGRTIQCWGLVSFGVSTPPAGAFSQIATGALHSCGVRTDGTVACWGNNTSGEATAPSGTFTQVSAGFNRSCGVTTAGSIVCWGDATQGPPPAGMFVEVSVGGEHSCARKMDGTIVCWGSDVEGALQVPSGTFTAIAASIYSHDYSCAIRTNGELALWGSPGVPEAQVPVANSDFRADSCRRTCWLPTCGDEVIDSGEQCDDGGTASGDGCSSACMSE
jgi:cysteine-rich repeat protein